MKKSIKLFVTLLCVMCACLVGNEVVGAASNAPSTFKAETYSIKNKPFGLSQNISIKKNSDGKYIYCLDVNKKLPDSNVVYSNDGIISDPVVNYIILSGNEDKTDNEFFATQSALWIYLLDTNQMSDTISGYVKNIKDAVYGTKYYNDSIARDIRNILENAKVATDSNSENYIKIVNDDISFTLYNGYYVSELIRLESNVELSDYNVELANEPTGTIVSKGINGFQLVIPAEKVYNDSYNISMVVYKEISVNHVYKYVASNSNYQNMLASYSNEITAYDTASATLVNEDYESEPEELISVIVSKKDVVTKKELPGAKLVIKDRFGRVVYRWTSTNKPFVIEGIEEGKYTLEEISAPEGYILSGEKITFEVEDNGVVTEVVMFNTPEHIEVVVPPTGLDATKISYIFGGLIIIIGSVLIYKNVKKEQ